MIEGEANYYLIYLKTNSVDPGSEERGRGIVYKKKLRAARGARNNFSRWLRKEGLRGQIHYRPASVDHRSWTVDSGGIMHIMCPDSVAERLRQAPQIESLVSVTFEMHL